MTHLYNYLPDLTDPASLPAKGILSQTIYDDNHTRAVLFGFAPGEELSEHTASMPAIMHILQGEARITVGGDTYQAGANAWVHMAANLPHSVHAKTPLIMLLLMLKSAK
ncbi:MAG: cupin domain-containing protein [Chloroflexi bacterium]|nr:cupin domain-containing protein [Chloroflexota bacterium]